MFGPLSFLSGVLEAPLFPRFAFSCISCSFELLLLTGIPPFPHISQCYYVRIKTGLSAASSPVRTLQTRLSLLCFLYRFLFRPFLLCLHKQLAPLPFPGNKVAADEKEDIQPLIARHRHPRDLWRNP